MAATTDNHNHHLINHNHNIIHQQHPQNLNILVSNGRQNPQLHSSTGASPAQTPLPTTAAPASLTNAPDPNTSIHSILASAKKPPQNPQANGQLPVWTVAQSVDPQHSEPNNHQHAMTPINHPSSSNGKRKLDEAESGDDPHQKIRRIVRDHVLQDPSRAMPMTTVVCLHAAVAQKSYGSEKRFLCPPPVVHIEGPMWNLRSQQLAMSVVSETGERSFEQKSTLDANLTASFKFLHVTGTAKAKSFQLSLDIAEPLQPVVPPEEGQTAPPGRVWASFDSAPVTIISKPSKKTAKTRNISSCILAGGPVSLFNRINSQTVRTKYMTIDQNKLCASNVAWSAFNVDVIRRPTENTSMSGGPQPVTYGCEIILIDHLTGVATSPLIIRKVDKGRVSVEDGGPVSQMQKIALQRANSDGTRHYLSAAGPMPGAPGVVTPSAPGVSSQAGTHALVFQSPRVKDEMKDGIRTISDEVDDYLCWTIVGISKFQYTFFDAFGRRDTVPSLPITPFPTLFTAPVYRPGGNTIELTISNFFYEDSKTGTQKPLDIYLGNIGPLRQRVYHTAQTGPLTSVSPFMQSLTGGPPQADGTAPGPSADPAAAGGAAGAATTSGAPRYVGPGPLHTIVVVDLPPISDILKALEENSLASSQQQAATNGEASNASQQSSHPPNDPQSAPSAQNESRNGMPPPLPPHPMGERSLPLLFVRSADGVGYHSGRTIACENVFQTMDLGGIGGNPPNPAAGNIDTGWLAAAQAAAAADGGLHGWQLRVL